MTCTDLRRPPREEVPMLVTAQRSPGCLPPSQVRRASDLGIIAPTSKDHTRVLMRTSMVSVWDDRCPGLARGKSNERCAPLTYFSFPYRGVYVSWVGTSGRVAEPNQMVIFNADEPYRVSHPIPREHASLTVTVDPAALAELVPHEIRDPRRPSTLDRSVLRVDAATQLLASQLRLRLSRRTVGNLEAEGAVLHLIRQAAGLSRSSALPLRGGRPRRMAENVKMLLASDPRRRWTLAEIAGIAGVSPVYLTDSFRQVEGIPLYRYQLRLRLACALDALADQDDITALAFDVGFSSHSHFSSAFKKAFGCTPSQFRGAVSNSRGPAISAALSLAARDRIPWLQGVGGRRVAVVA